jgi:hypothetical protein
MKSGRPAALPVPASPSDLLMWLRPALSWLSSPGEGRACPSRGCLCPLPAGALQYQGGGREQQDAVWPRLHLWLYDCAMLRSDLQHLILRRHLFWIPQAQH